jgi:ferrochelatase
MSPTSHSTSDHDNAEGSRYDALVLTSFGGPEGPDDVMAFLENVTRGRNVPDERLAIVAEQYEQFGGVSPINRLNRELIVALEAELAARGRPMDIRFGNRNWHPFIGDTVQQLADEGASSLLALATSAYSGYSGCRQYRDDLDRAASLATSTVSIDKIRPFWNHPGFIAANAAQITECAAANAKALTECHILFTAHSIPVTYAATSDYELQLRDASQLVIDQLITNEQLSGGSVDLVFQSRSGPPQVPWLEPDICDKIANLADAGVTDIIVCPIGFVSDHMEVLYDLDTQAASIARAHGITMMRAATAGTHPTFVACLADLIDERTIGAEPASLGRLGPRMTPCNPSCCQIPQRPSA